VNDLIKPSRAVYPCEDCRDTVPSLYCDACRAQREKELAAKRQRDDQKRKAKNQRQRERYHAVKQWHDRRVKPTQCGTCGKAFKPKRSDAQYCSAACRQRAYVKRDGKVSNAKPLDPREIERVILNALTSNPDSAFTTGDLCARVYPGLKRPERKHRAAVVPIAKRVCERLGEHWDWCRGFAWSARGAPFVFYNQGSVTSFAMARMKSDWLHSYKSEEDLKAEIAPGGSNYKYVVEGGAWSEYCQEYVAKNNAGRD
jgi:hypothetical protein